MGTIAFGNSAGSEVKVSSEAPGPHRMMAWKPGEGSELCGILYEYHERNRIRERKSESVVGVVLTLKSREESQNILIDQSQPFKSNHSRVQHDGIFLRYNL
jgi:hypothetical protein